MRKFWKRPTLLVSMGIAAAVLASCAPSTSTGYTPPPSPDEVFVLGDSISANWPGMNGYLAISQGGAHLDWLRDMIPLMAEVPDTMVVMGGINDIMLGFSVADMKADILGIKADLDALGVRRVMIATITGWADNYVPASSLPTFRAKRTEFNTWIRATFPDSADCGSVFGEPPTTLWGYSDGVHPYTNGEELLAACMQVEIGY
ncbi:MAG TPA: SGNH/GDSL hydrolase family protein [Microthrixaceae bacterium]|nr:SGNH/GDSL hydrolase family protein [Microthrixaceae bacterium]